MKVAVIGTGYVGLVSAACLAEIGHVVSTFDVDAFRIEQLSRGVVPIFEPGLDELLWRNVAHGRVTFERSLASALEKAQVVLLAVGTPTDLHSGAPDTTAVFAAMAQVCGAISHSALIVCKSTVPVGTNRALAHEAMLARPDLSLLVGSNPEFLREGNAVADFMRPDRIVVGADDARAFAMVRDLYHPLGMGLFETDFESAELIKYATNAFLAVKVGFINEMADLCEAVGGTITDVARGLGADHRIGSAFLHPGPGYGGSCFPKDIAALLHVGRAAGVEAAIVEATAASNSRRKKGLAARVAGALGTPLDGMTIAVLGVTFKANTDDLRESPALTLIPDLLASGARVRAYDPKGMAHASAQLPSVRWCNDAYGAAEAAHAVVIVTEWPEFLRLDLKRVRTLMAGSAMVDLRNMFDPRHAELCGFEHFGVGRPRVECRRREAAE